MTRETTDTQCGVTSMRRLIEYKSLSYESQIDKYVIRNRRSDVTNPTARNSPVSFSQACVTSERARGELQERVRREHDAPYFYTAAGCNLTSANLTRVLHHARADPDVRSFFSS
ncbi:hypothetical protein EVAR_62550_1 [Eumeta japonica]|uniref:Uncharacterized protein n=1 Tax=Eumeta variegata TaxID=151549 RepID=A0A4C1YYE3_EUMVA|nr:hypothetical protein EVAR_62550_1 [Eumeta japonica]